MLSFWTTKVPTAAWITIFWIVIIAVNVVAVRFFGEVEVTASTIKFGWIFVVIISCIGKWFKFLCGTAQYPVPGLTSLVISAGGAPAEGPIGFRYWNSSPFINGFKGFLSIMPTCIFAMRYLTPIIWLYFRVARIGLEVCPDCYCSIPS